MSNLHKLSDYIDMSQEQFQLCLERMDIKTFMDNPTQAMLDAGVTLKKGITFKLVKSEEEAKAVPSNVIPLIWTPKNNNDALSMENLDKVAGGNLDSVKGFLHNFYNVDLAGGGGGFSIADTIFKPMY